MNQIAQTRELKLQLVSNEKSFKSVLPKQISIELFNRTIVTATEINPYLLTLDRDSLINACKLAAADGLMLDGREAALVPFKNEVKYIRMYTGVLKKIRQSGQLSSIFCEVVTREEYESKNFRYWVDMNGQNILHNPDLDSDGELFCAYMFATLKDGSKQLEVVSGKRIRAIRDKQLGQIKEQWKREKAPWFMHEIPMWKKTALLSGAKYLPQSKEIEETFELESAVQEIDITPKQGQLQQAKSKLDALADKFEQVEQDDDLPKELF